AGPDGLAAAARLGRAGLKTIVIERATTVGGRCTTREFHPGFRASPFADEVAAIPAGIFWSLDLARRGALLAPPPSHAFVEQSEMARVAATALTAITARARTRVGRE